MNLSIMVSPRNSSASSVRYFPVTLKCSSQDSFLNYSDFGGNPFSLNPFYSGISVANSLINDREAIIISSAMSGVKCTVSKTSDP